MNTICTLMTDTEITLSLGAVCLVIALVTIYRTAVSNRKPEKH
ncbi:hypothetical protein AAKU52_002784 [Pedobacter sp. CG_S7]